MLNSSRLKKKLVLDFFFRGGIKLLLDVGQFLLDKFQNVVRVPGRGVEAKAEAAQVQPIVFHLQHGQFSRSVEKSHPADVSAIAQKVLAHCVVPFAAAQRAELREVELGDVRI